MKFLCPQCERLVELKEFRMEAGALAVTCPACHVVSRVSPATSPPRGVPPVTSSGERPALQLTSAPGLSNVVALRTPGTDAVAAAAQAARHDPFEVPHGFCPKCLSPRLASAATCSSCGLDFAGHDPAQLQPPDWLKNDWVQLLERWDAEPLHVAARTRAYDEQQLPALGRLYRLRLAALPEDPIAQRGRDEVLRLALIPSTQPQPPAAPTIRVAWVLWAIGLVVAISGVVLFARLILSNPE